MQQACIKKRGLTGRLGWKSRHMYIRLTVVTRPQTGDDVTTSRGKIDTGGSSSKFTKFTKFKKSEIRIKSALTLESKAHVEVGVASTRFAREFKQRAINKCSPLWPLQWQQIILTLKSSPDYWYNLVQIHQKMFYAKLSKLSSQSHTYTWHDELN